MCLPLEQSLQQPKPKLRHFFYTGCALAFALGAAIALTGRVIEVPQLLVCSAGITALAYFIVMWRLEC